MINTLIHSGCPVWKLTRDLTNLAVAFPIVLTINWFWDRNNKSYVSSTSSKSTPSFFTEVS